MKKKELGFSLIEVLISLFILSIGLLGLAGLQTSSLRISHQSYMRTLAMTQAYDMIERMQANPAGVEAGNYNSITGTPSDPSCSVCSTSERATKDAYQWNTANGNLLPSGQGTVTGNGSYFTVVVRWDDARTGATGINCGSDTSVDLTCYTVNVMF